MITFERFEAAKIKRFIQRYSKPYLFQRSILDEYKQPINAPIDLCIINGVYHEASYKHLASTASAAGVNVPEIEPMILCLKDENSDKIKSDDLVEVNGKIMIVTKVKDINNSGFAYDVSLRWKDNGSEA